MKTLSSPWFWLLLILFFPLLLLLYLIEAYYRRRFPFQPRRFPRREYYIHNQVIVTGREADVDAAIAKVKNASLKQEKRLRFSQIGSGLLNCADLPHGEGQQGLVIDLYTIEDRQPNVEAAIGEINAALGQESGSILAEPNRLTGHPWEPEGSPWEPEGSPWEPEGSPLEKLFGGRHKKSQDAPADLFMDQWAFDNIELHNLDRKPSGADVRVGIFDTSPYVDDDNVLAVGGDTKDVTWVNVKPESRMKLVVRHATSRAELGRNSRRPIDVRNHGLFVAGMIYALAEESELYLVRVLQDDNRGDLFTLLEALFDFIKDSLGPNSSPRGVVINLSLGIRVPREEEVEEAGIDRPSSILALEYLLRAAHCLGAVIVAAAGNESSGLAKPADANWPAAWPETIGVAASNIDNHHACFSNAGNIHAPGGEGGTRDCIPQADECEGNCELAVIGPILKSPENTGFIYWTGSSFAAPMVSGLAALVIQAGNFQLTPTQVEEKILCGAQVNGKGVDQVNVINVRRTLQECLASDLYSQEMAQAE